MGRPELKLIREESDGGARRWPALGVGASLIGVALLATTLGADALRQAAGGRDMAEETLRLSLQPGTADEVHQRVVSLRRSLGASPLDSHTRVAYAALLLRLSRTLDDTRAAAFHAARAASLAPVTLSVQRQAARVLVACGRPTESLALVRSAFEFDPEAAARLLGVIEPMLLGPEAEEGLPETPEAWLAWSSWLGRNGRIEAADGLLERAHQRWPDDLSVLDPLRRRHSDPRRLGPARGTASRAAGPDRRTGGRSPAAAPGPARGGRGPVG